MGKLQAKDDEREGKTARGASPRPAGKTPRTMALVDTARASASTSLPASLSTELSAAAGADVSQVGVHTGAPSERAAAALGARAFADGDQLHFAAGAYNPDSVLGRHLIAHEVAHTLQRDTGPRAKPVGRRGADAAELEADGFADWFVSDRRAPAPTIAGERQGIALKDDEDTGEEDAGEEEAGPATAEFSKLRSTVSVSTVALAGGSASVTIRSRLAGTVELPEGMDAAGLATMLGAKKAKPTALGTALATTVGDSVSVSGGVGDDGRLTLEASYLGQPLALRMAPSADVDDAFSVDLDFSLDDSPLRFARGTPTLAGSASGTVAVTWRWSPSAPSPGRGNQKIDIASATLGSIAAKKSSISSPSFAARGSSRGEHRVGVDRSAPLGAHTARLVGWIGVEGTATLGPGGAASVDEAIKEAIAAAAASGALGPDGGRWSVDIGGQPLVVDVSLGALAAQKMLTVVINSDDHPAMTFRFGGVDFTAAKTALQLRLELLPSVVGDDNTTTAKDAVAVSFGGNKVPHQLSTGVDDGEARAQVAQPIDFDRTVTIKRSESLKIFGADVTVGGELELDGIASIGGDLSQDEMLELLGASGKGRAGKKLAELLSARAHEPPGIVAGPAVAFGGSIFGQPYAVELAPEADLNDDMTISFAGDIASGTSFELELGGQPLRIVAQGRFSLEARWDSAVSVQTRGNDRFSVLSARYAGDGQVVDVASSDTDARQAKGQKSTKLDVPVKISLTAATGQLTVSGNLLLRGPHTVPHGVDADAFAALLKGDAKALGEALGTSVTDTASGGAARLDAGAWTQLDVDILSQPLHVGLSERADLGDGFAAKLAAKVSKGTPFASAGDVAVGGQSFRFSSETSATLGADITWAPEPSAVGSGFGNDETSFADASFAGASASVKVVASAGKETREESGVKVKIEAARDLSGFGAAIGVSSTMEITKGKLSYPDEIGTKKEALVRIDGGDASVGFGEPTTLMVAFGGETLELDVAVDALVRGAPYEVVVTAPLGGKAAGRRLVFGDVAVDDPDGSIRSRFVIKPPPVGDDVVATYEQLEARFADEPAALEILAAGTEKPTRGKRLDELGGRFTIELDEKPGGRAVTLGGRLVLDGRPQFGAGDNGASDATIAEDLASYLLTRVARLEGDTISMDLGGHAVVIKLGPAALEQSEAVRVFAEIALDKSEAFRFDQIRIDNASARLEIDLDLTPPASGDDGASPVLDADDVQIFWGKHRADFNLRKIDAGFMLSREAGVVSPEALARLTELEKEWRASGIGGLKKINSDEKRRDFLLFMRSYFGADGATLAHFDAIRRVSVPGNLWLHDAAATALEGVYADGSLGKKPETSIGFSFRDAFGTGLQGRGRGQHTLGFALDFNARDNPHLEGHGKYIIEAFGSKDGETAHVNARPGKGYADRNDKVRGMREGTIGKAEADAFIAELESELVRINQLSADFTGSLGTSRDRLFELRGDYRSFFEEELPALQALVGPATEEWRAEIARFKGETGDAKEANNEAKKKLKELSAADRAMLGRIESGLDDASFIYKLTTHLTDSERFATLEPPAGLELVMTPELEAFRLAYDVKISPIATELRQVIKPWIDAVDEHLDRARAEYEANPGPALRKRYQLIRELREEFLHDPELVLFNTDGSGADRALVSETSGSPSPAQLVKEGYINNTNSSLSIEFIKAMARAGFLPGATFDSIDAMHFEFEP